MCPQERWFNQLDSTQGSQKSYPIELDDFAQLHGINEESAFAWWIPYVERKRKSMISKLKSKYWQITHKYGINIPKYVKEAYEFHEEDGNKLWTYGIKEEMNKVRLAVQESNVSPKKISVIKRQDCT